MSNDLIWNERSMLSDDSLTYNNDLIHREYVCLVSVVMTT